MCRDLFLSCLFGVLLSAPVRGAELAILTNENWSRLAPEGKEADCILGDYAFRSDRLMVVVAQPLPTRNANMTLRQVGGAVIDCTLVNHPNAQFSAYYSGIRQHLFNNASIIQSNGNRVFLKC